MLVNLKNQFIILFFFIFSIFSCGKEDTTIPSIIINKPLSNDSFQIPTNINIVGSTWDDNKIDRIEIDVVSENSATIIQKIELDADTNYFEFNISFSLIDRLINSDNYFINVKSFDENDNFNSEYVPVYVNEVPKILQSTYYIISTNNLTNLYEIDSLNNLHLKCQKPGNYNISIGNSRHQYLFIGTDEIGESVEPLFYTSLWDLSLGTTLSYNFTGVLKSDDGNQLFVGYEDGRIFTINKDGNIINSIYSNNQDFFGEFFVDKDLVLVESKTNSLDKKLVVFFKQSGIEKQRINISGTVKKILPKGNHQYIVASNFFGTAKLNIYYENSNSMTTELEIPNCEIYDVIILNNNILIASSNGLYNFNLSGNLISTISTSHFCNKIVKGEQNQDIYLICGNELWSYNSSGSLNLVNTVFDSIRDYLPFYNK